MGSRCCGTKLRHQSRSLRSSLALARHIVLCRATRLLIMVGSIISSPRNEGPALSFLNTLTFIKAHSAQTGGAFGLIEQLAPVGSGSPYHIHRGEDESFYILEGQLEFLSEGKRFIHGPGGYVFLPRDIAHGFRVVGTEPARFLILVCPGGFEGFVAELGESIPEPKMPKPSEPDMGRLVTLAKKYKLEILGPLPA
jgi:quercetin dioxygenase-like cupin family protein